MTLLRQYRMASFLLALLSIVAFAIAELDFSLLFVATVLAMLSWYVTEGPRGRTLPDWLINTLAVGAILWQGFDFLSRGDLADAMGALGRGIAWVLVLKLYARRTASEERQRFSLSTMLVIAGCLESVQFAFGLLVIAYVGVAIWAAMLWRLARSADEARATRAVIAGFAPPLEIAVGRRTQPQFRGIVATSIVAVLAAGIGVFVVFPRFAEFRGAGLGGRGAVTGFNDEIRLRRGDRITESRRELFTVRWVDPDGAVRRLPRPLLLRGAVLVWYDELGERWVPARTEAGVRTMRTPENGEFEPLARAIGSFIGPSSRLQFEMRSYATDVVFSVYAPIAIATSEPRSISIDPASLILRDVSTDRMSRSWSYELRVQQQPAPALLQALTLGSDPRDRYLEFPVDSVKPVAEAMRSEVRASMNAPAEPSADATDAERWVYSREMARAIAAWMRSNFAYTTDLSSFPRIEGEDPILSFLTRYRSGHCEYFASGLCAVLRALGIESRIVTGFIAIEYDESAEHYVVRESNAHAWVEVRTGRDSWIAVDATPEESLLEIQERNRSWVDRFRWIYGRLEFLWNSRVVAYDASAQTTMAGRVQSGWRDAIGARIESLLATTRALISSLSLGRAVGVWLAAVAIAVMTALLAWWIVVRRRNALRDQLGLGGTALDDQRRLLRDAAFFAEALQALRNAGFSRSPHQTHRAFATEVAEAHADAGAIFGVLVESYYRVRYGGGIVDRDEADSHLSRVSDLKRVLRQKREEQRAD